MSLFRFIEAEKANHPVGALCRALGVSRAGFYAWLKRPLSARARGDAELLERIRAIHADTKRLHGTSDALRQLAAPTSTPSTQRRLMPAHSPGPRPRRGGRGTSGS